MSEDTYRQELDAAHARIAALERDLASRASAHSEAVVLGILQRQRAQLAAEAAHTATPSQLAVFAALIVILIAFAIAFLALGESPMFSAMALVMAALVWFVVRRATVRRAAYLRHRVALLDERIAQLPLPRDEQPPPA